MSKPNGRRFKLSQLRQQHAEKVGDTIEIETDKGEVFSFPAPGFWEDDVRAAFQASNDVEGVRKLLGPRRYLEFRAAGGRADDVALAMQEFSKEQGMNSTGESSASQPS